MESKKKKIYGNRRVYHPDGSLMFYCDDKRANWYLDRNLATVQSDPSAIQLNFIPNGCGHKNDPFYLRNRENKCVVCGSLSDLTRHHVVPYCFRKHFPEKLKNRSSHDIIPLCIPCHNKYEESAMQLKKNLAVKYCASFYCGEISEEDLIKNQACGAAKNLLQHWDKMPSIRREHLFSKISLYLKKPCSTLEDIVQNFESLIKHKETIVKNDSSYGKTIVQNVEDLPEFMRMWRQHFLDTMKPQYLTEGWDVNHIHSRQDQQ